MAQESQENHLEEIVRQFTPGAPDPPKNPEESEPENPEELDVGEAEGLPDEQPDEVLVTPESEPEDPNTMPVRYSRGGSLEFQHQGQFYTITPQTCRLPREVAQWACQQYEGLIVPA